MKPTCFSTVLLSLIIASTLACSKVGFGQGDASSNVTASANGNVHAQVTPPGTPPPSPTPNPALLPKIEFISPPCIHNSQCEVEFRLDQAYTSETQFDWRTNDMLYLTPHTPVYGTPGVHYVTNSGHTVFMPGEISKKVYIQNINPYSYDIIIGIVISHCAYADSVSSCTGFFF